MSKKYFIYRSFLIIGLFMSVFLISCSNDEEPKPVVQDNSENEPIAKKWEVDNTVSNGRITTAASDFLWFEFTVEGYYIIRKSDLSNLVGTYTMNGNTIALDGVGVLEISDVSETNFSFTFTATGATESVTIFTNVAEQIIDQTTKTDLMCKTWSVKRQHGKYFGLPLDQTYPNEAISKFTVIFSSYGTYVVLMEYTSGAKQIFNRLWRWKDAEETMICYGDLSSECGDDNQTTVIELTAESFKLYSVIPALEYEMTDELIVLVK